MPDEKQLLEQRVLGMLAGMHFQLRDIKWLLLIHAFLLVGLLVAIMR